jgi:hypothetical protein
MHSTRPYGRVLCFLGYEAKGQTFASHTSRTSGLPYGVFITEALLCIAPQLQLISPP